MTVDRSRVLELPSGTLTVNASAASDRGLVRKVNEDSFLARPPVYLVADGMGGHSFGDLASQTLVATFAALFPDEHATRPEEILDAVGQANANVMGLIDESHAPGSVAGTTVTGIALVDADDAAGPGWMIFNVGDSRVYGWNGTSPIQLTVDHSAVQELVNRGLIAAEQAAVHPERNIITRAVGADVRVQTDAWLMPVRGRQLFLACSDGLNKELDDDAIAAVLADRAVAGSAPADVAQALVDAAAAAGGRDNVTVVVVESVFVPTAGCDSDAPNRDAEPGRGNAQSENTAPRA